MNNPIHNRESYLTALMHALYVDVLSPVITRLAMDEPDTSKWRVSCSWPSKSIRKRIGECWSETASADGLHEMFISPMLADVKALDHVLLHEMVHAVVGTAAGHKGPFAKLAKAVGLEGKMTSTTPGAALREQLDAIAAKLGAYPHAALSPNEGKKQTTRLLKIQCPICGCTARITQKWADVGRLSCPDGDPMFLDGEENEDV